MVLIMDDLSSLHQTREIYASNEVNATSHTSNIAVFSLEELVDDKGEVRVKCKEETDPKKAQDLIESGKGAYCENGKWSVGRENPENLKKAFKEGRTEAVWKNGKVTRNFSGQVLSISQAKRMSQAYQEQIRHLQNDMSKVGADQPITFTASTTPPTNTPANIPTPFAQVQQHLPKTVGKASMEAVRQNEKASASEARGDTRERR